MGCASSAPAGAQSVVELPEAVEQARHKIPVKTPHLSLVLWKPAQWDTAFVALTGQDAVALGPALLRTVQLFHPKATQLDVTKTSAGSILNDASVRYDFVIRLHADRNFRQGAWNQLVRDDLHSLTGRAGVLIMDLLLSEGYALVSSSQDNPVQGRTMEAIFKKVAAGEDPDSPKI